MSAVYEMLALITHPGFATVDVNNDAPAAAGALETHSLDQSGILSTYCSRK
jgi:hypothetical protein